MQQKNALCPRNILDPLPSHPWPPYHMAAATYSYQAGKGGAA